MSFSVTGGYKVAGVDLLPGSAVDGFVSGTIQITGVPANADILAAYLYWETISNGPVADGAVGATFRGRSITVDHAVSMSSADLGAATAPCWTSGGGGTASYVLTMYRADVLPLLPLQVDANNISTGRRRVNDVDLSSSEKLVVRLPEAGTGNQTPQSAGASLFVVYRDPNPAAPLTKIVDYDGLFVQTQGQAMQHTIRGFQDAANANPVIKMTHIVGSGANNASDQVYFNGAVIPGSLNSFRRTSGGTSDRGWSNPTFENLSFPEATQNLQSDGQYGEWVTTKVDHGGNDSPNDCLAWAAIILSTTVQDTDGDGLTDRAETADNVSAAGVPYGLKEPDEELLPNVKTMGGSPTQQDIFIEVGAMKAPGGTTYGSSDAPFSSTLTSVTDPTGHNHLPTPAALKLVGDAFLEKNIHVHFDVGAPSAYHGLGGAYASAAADAYLVGTGSGGANLPINAKGGESVNEASCGGPCPFPAYPGTVSWKTGFGLYKDLLFDHNRKDFFHYAFYAHAKGTHKSPFPCVDVSDNPALMNEDGACDVGPNPEFFVPKGISGSGDYPGGDFLVTLGFFDNTHFTGSDFVVASTTMHELGHNLGLGHGGQAAPNCKPNYLSVMNYMFQLGGLVDIDGIAHLAYSDTDNPDIDETSLSDDYSLPGPYRTSWYAPRPAGDTRTPAKRFCSGQAFPDPLPAGWVNTIRIDGTPGSPIDWNANGAFGFGIDGSGSTILSGSQDVNFDGDAEGGATALTGYNDWASLRLNQTGSRRSILGLSIESTLLFDGTQTFADGTLEFSDGTQTFADGTVELADGTQTFADGTLEYADGTQTFADGTVEYADGTIRAVDGTIVFGTNGVIVFSDGAVLTSGGSADFGANVVFENSKALLGNGVIVFSDGTQTFADGTDVFADGSSLTSNFNELSPRFATESGNIPGPRELKACVIGVGGCTTPSVPSPPTVTLHRIRLDWKEPTVGDVLEYQISRVVGDTVPSGAIPVLKTVPGSQLSAIDNDELPNNVTFTYFVVAKLVDGSITGRSNYRTIQAVNNPPENGTNLIANNYETNQGVPLTVAAPGVLGNDTAGADSYPTSLSAVSFTGSTSQGGTVALSANGGFTYTPPAGFAGTDTFTYLANNGPWSGNPSVMLSLSAGPVNVTITVRPVMYTVTIDPLKTPAKLGSAVPVSFQVKLGGVIQTSTSIVKEIDSSFVPLPASGVCPAPSANGVKEVLFKSPDFSTGKSTLRYISTSQTLQFNWDTTSAMALPAPVTNQGCYTVLIYLNDLDPAGNPTAPRLTTVVQLK